MLRVEHGLSKLCAKIAACVKETIMKDDTKYYKLVYITCRLAKLLSTWSVSNKVKLLRGSNAHVLWGSDAKLETRFYIITPASFTQMFS